MIKVRGLGKGEVLCRQRLGMVGGGRNLHPAGEGQALPGPTQYSTAGLKAPALFPLSLVPLVLEDETDTSVYFVIRTLECLCS